jgi:hypothetical protein
MAVVALVVDPVATLAAANVVIPLAALADLATRIIGATPARVPAPGLAPTPSQFSRETRFVALLPAMELHMRSLPDTMALTILIGSTRARSSESLDAIRAVLTL